MLSLDYTFEDSNVSSQLKQTTALTPVSSQLLVSPQAYDSPNQSGSRVPEIVSTQKPELPGTQLNLDWDFSQDYDLTIFAGDSSEAVPFDSLCHDYQTEAKLPSDLAYLKSRHEHFLDSQRLDIAKSHQQIALAETESQCQLELIKLELERAKLRQAVNYKGQGK